MKVTLREVSLHNFKNHKANSFDFGVLNVIKGQNGEGKTTIGEAVAWVLFGTDMMGSKLDPTPQQGAELVGAMILLNVDGKEISFTRELKKGKAQFCINDVPKKAKEFDEVVASMFNKDLFLSLFNPSYFPALHWTTQREMILSYVTAPGNKEVFKQLPGLQSEALADALKKHNIDDLEAIHKKNKTTKEKELIAAKARVETLEESNTAEPRELSELEKQFAEVEKELVDAREINWNREKVRKQLSEKEHALQLSFKQVERIKAAFMETKAATNCPTCKQALPEESHRKALETINADYKEEVAKYKALKAEIDKTGIPEDYEQHAFEQLHELRGNLQQDIRTERARLEAVAKIEEAKQNVEAVLKSLNESIFLLDAIKAYRAKLAELQAKKVQDLFPTLTIRLYNTTKDGSENPTFEIEKDGKPYSKLSLGEKARAGLEVVDVISNQSDIFAPCFVDNAESITNVFMRKEESQLIAAYAVPNQTLTMEVDQ